MPPMIFFLSHTALSVTDIGAFGTGSRLPENSEVYLPLVALANRLGVVFGEWTAGPVRSFE